MEAARSLHDDAWKNKYTYEDQGQRKPHNPHFSTKMYPEVDALLSLYECRCAGFVNGMMLVAKTFTVDWDKLSRHWGDKTIIAANEGPIDAPIEQWQKILSTLLDYAVKHGYKDPWNHEQKHPSE